MATPPPPPPPPPVADPVAEFMRITGASKSVAVQKLMEYGGNLNEAINAHFLSLSSGHNIPSENLNNQNRAGSSGLSSIFNAARTFRPSRLLDPNYRSELRDIYNGIGRTASASRAPPPLTFRPRESWFVPVEINSTILPPYQPGMGSTSADMTGNLSSHHGGIYGTDDYQIDSTLAQSNTSRVPGNDAEEAMVQAAIEASKKDKGKRPSWDTGESSSWDTGDSSSWEPFSLNGSFDDVIPEINFQQDDYDLEKAISLSLKTAEQERAIREHLVMEEKEGLGVHDFNRELTNSSRGRFEIGSSFSQTVVQDVAQPVMGHQLDNSAGNHLQGNKEVFLADMWGGISSEELDEALLLESALFGETTDRSSHKSSPLPDLQHHPEKNVDPKMQLPGQKKDADCLASLQVDKQKESDSLKKAETLSSKEVSCTNMFEKDLEKMLDKKEVRLPEEPPLDDDKAITIVVRMPDGSRCERRFLKTDKLQLLFDFVDINGAVKPGTYRVVKSYPRRVCSINDSSSTLNEVGLSNKNEALFLELI